MVESSCEFASKAEPAGDDHPGGGLFRIQAEAEAAQRLRGGVFGAVVAGLPDFEIQRVHSFQPGHIHHGLPQELGNAESDIGRGLPARPTDGWAG